MSTHPTTLATPARMKITGLRDPYVEAHGHGPGSPYLEHVYVGLLGPTSCWLWTRTARMAGSKPSTVVDMEDLATSLGLGHSLSQNAAMSRTLARLVHFDAAMRSGDNLAVRLALPDVPVHRLGRLSSSARLAHQAFAKNPATRPFPQVSDPRISIEAQASQGVAL